MVYTGMRVEAFYICIVDVNEMLSKMCLVILWIVVIVIAWGRRFRGLLRASGRSNIGSYWQEGISRLLQPEWGV